MFVRRVQKGSKKFFYGCLTRIFAPNTSFYSAQEAHHGFLLKCLNEYIFTRGALHYLVIAYREVPEKTDCGCI